MISFAFLLCSTLLLSGVIAEEETSIDIAQDYVIEYVKFYHLFNEWRFFDTRIFLQMIFVFQKRPQDPVHVEAGKQAAAAAIKVLNDVGIPEVIICA